MLPGTQPGLWRWHALRNVCPVHHKEVIELQVRNGMPHNNGRRFEKCPVSGCTATGFREQMRGFGGGATAHFRFHLSLSSDMRSTTGWMVTMATVMVVTMVLACSCDTSHLNSLLVAFSRGFHAPPQPRDSSHERGRCHPGHSNTLHDVHARCPCVPEHTI